MMRVVFAVTGLAASLLLACAAQTRDMATPPAFSGGVAVPVQPSTHQDHSMTSASQGGELLSGARDVAQRLLTFLSEAQFTSDLAQENVEKHMGAPWGLTRRTVKAGLSIAAPLSDKAGVTVFSRCLRVRP